MGYIYPKCIDCGKQLSRTDAKRCKKCSKQGFLHGRATHGKCFTSNYCSCGAKISRYAKICLACLYKQRSKQMLEKWSNLEYKQKVIKKWMSKALILPNKPEKILIKLLTDILPKEYEYVGNGKVLLKGFNPDFINVNGQKKIIEFFGDYWHNFKHYKQNKTYLPADRKRLGAYKSLGYKTLIIWENELKDMGQISNKIKQFNEVL